MQLDLQPGTYVLAVSGGVDSMALLHLLAERPQPAYSFTVAHFDHGIRDDSRQDRQLVQSVTQQHGLPFVYHEGRLGARTSEATARQARYDFLHQARQASGARAIITAHHQDDVLETVLLNLLRGTGRKGFSSLKSTDIVKRPLLHLTKQQLRDYAAEHQLQWREDSTNQDRRYLRNYLRHEVVAKMTPEQRQQLLALVEHMHAVNDELDTNLDLLLHVQPALDRLERHQFLMLPHAVGLELLASWFRRHGISNFDRRTLQRVSQAAKTYRPGQRADITAGWQLLIGKRELALKKPQRGFL